MKKYWGYDDFRAPQEHIINNVLHNKDTIALLPTGGGKSICFQIPALMFHHKTIVISPLIALMQDQVDQLSIRNIKSKALNSNLSYKEIEIILDNFIFGDLKLLYIPGKDKIRSFFNENRTGKDKSYCGR
ncbi:MAG: DEAD/DEAH box helicase [Saprospiraceae bacterium]|nr:DEAD/DEAH box helicase [Saprospiraceae bacterium]